MLFHVWQIDLEIQILTILKKNQLKIAVICFMLKHFLPPSMQFISNPYCFLFESNENSSRKLISKVSFLCFFTYGTGDISNSRSTNLTKKRMQSILLRKE